VAALLAAPPARPVVPSAQKIADSLAETNDAAGRAEPLLVDVRLRFGDADPVADGVLATHPTGLARLELRSQTGFVERHLLQGSDHRASRDGKMLSSFRPFLPPLFLLQAGSGAALRAALASFGVASGEAVLGMSGERDCYVFGGRLPETPEGQEQRVPSLWVDMDSFQVIQVDRHDGVRFRFGPEGAFDGIRLPRWVEIDAPGQSLARLEIVRVARADAPAAAFRSDWLVAAPGP
jgi:hypothetical protein